MMKQLRRWLSSHNRASKARRQLVRPRPSVRPFLEALEERWVPANLTWKGNISTDWFTAGNWIGGAVPGATDTAIFDNNAVGNVSIAATKTAEVGQLVGVANFNAGVDINGVLKVHLDSGLGPSTWADNNPTSGLWAWKELDFVGAGSMTFFGGGVFGGGNFNVTGGANVLFTSNFGVFQPGLNVGDAQTVGTIELKDLNGNIIANTNINVSAHGTFKMDQTTATSTQNKGGLVQTGNAPFGTFTNSGTFIRAGGSADGTFPVLDFAFTNTGTFQITAGSDLFFSRKDANNNSFINNSGGQVQLNNQSTVRAAGSYLQNAGLFQTMGGVSADFDLTSVFAGGSMDIGANGAIGTLTFGSHDVTFKGSFLLRVKLDGSRQGLCDQILISGGNQLTIDNTGGTRPSLAITTINAKPTAGWTYDMIVCPVLVGTFDPANVSFNGFNETYGLSYPAGPPRSVRLTAN